MFFQLDKDLNDFFYQLIFFLNELIFYPSIRVN